MKGIVCLLFLCFTLSAIESDEEFFDNRSVEEQSSEKAQALSQKAHFLTPIIQCKVLYKEIRSAIKKKYSLLYLSTENSEAIGDLILDKKLSYLYKIQIIDNRKIEDQGFNQALWDFHLLQKDFKKIGFLKTLKDPRKRQVLFEIQKRYPSHLSARHLYLYSKKKHKKSYSYSTAVQKIFDLSQKTFKYSNQYKYQKNKSHKRISSYHLKFKKIKKYAPKSVNKLMKAHLNFCETFLKIDKLNKKLAEHRQKHKKLKSAKSRSEHNRLVRDINSNVKSINKNRGKYFKEINQTIKRVNTMLQYHNKKIQERFKS